MKGHKSKISTSEGLFSVDLNVIGKLGLRPTKCISKLMWLQFRRYLYPII